MMKKNSELIVRYTDDTKYKSLYSWCLQEFDDQENKIGDEQIPWEWTQWFHARSIRFVKKHEDSRFDFSIDEKEKRDCSIKLETEENIVVDLEPGCFNPKNSTVDEYCSYSFFGTNRRINNFMLDISEVDAEDELGEICHISGIASYETEVDFQAITFDDILIIKVKLDSEKFLGLKDKVLCKQIDWMNLTLSKVSGFYSDWRPETSTNLIKILPRAYSEIEIQNTEELGKGFIPKLYQASGFSLSYGANSNLVMNSDLESLSSSDKEKDQFNEEPDYYEPNAADEKSQINQLDQLRLVMSQQEELHSTTRAVIFLAAIVIAVVQFFA